MRNRSKINLLNSSPSLLLTRIFHKDAHDVGHSSQIRSFAPAATFARVQRRNILQGLASSPPRTKSVEPSLLAHGVGWHRNYFFRKRPSFLAFSTVC